MGTDPVRVPFEGPDSTVKVMGSPSESAPLKTTGSGVSSGVVRFWSVAWAGSFTGCTVTVTVAESLCPWLSVAWNVN